MDVDLIAIYPHAHYLGKDIQALATLPDGTQKTLIHIPQWNLNWQAVYRYAAPVLLPKGTTVSLRYTYDNSDENPMNPHHPAMRVKGGNRSSDEMCHLWLQVLPVNFDVAKGDPRMALQEALARHNVRKILRTSKRTTIWGRCCRPKAIWMRLWRNIKRLCSCGRKTLLATMRWERHWWLGGVRSRLRGICRQRLKARPDYFDAHYNLGFALAQQDDFRGAVEHFRTALHLEPQDAAVEANLGAALAEMGHYADAKAHFEHALQLDPNQPIARENLQAMQNEKSQQ